MYLQELCQKEETLNGEIAAASARAKEQLSNEIRPRWAAIDVFPRLGGWAIDKMVL